MKINNNITDSVYLMLFRWPPATRHQKSSSRQPCYPAETTGGSAQRQAGPHKQEDRTETPGRSTYDPYVKVQLSLPKLC